MEIKGALSMANHACETCERKSYRAGSVLRCLEFKKYSNLARCSHYIGCHPERHVKVAGGPDYKDTLAHAGIKR